MPKLAAVKQAWQGRERGVVDRLTEHAANIGRAVGRYRHHEDAAGHDLVVVSEHAGGRPV